MGKLEAIRARHEDVPDVLALWDEAERLRGYKEREDQEGVHIHRCPRQGESVTPCCGKTPFEISGWHRMTTKPELVNCGRLELEAEVERLRGVVEAARSESSFDAWWNADIPTPPMPEIDLYPTSPFTPRQIYFGPGNRSIAWDAWQAALAALEGGDG